MCIHPFTYNICAQVMGPSMSMLVAAHQAYLLLPGKLVGRKQLVSASMWTHMHLATVRRQQQQQQDGPAYPPTTHSRNSTDGGGPLHTTGSALDAGTQLNLALSAVQPSIPPVDMIHPLNNILTGDEDRTQYRWLDQAVNELALMEVPDYYKSRHFRQVGSHAHSAWEDCMLLLLLQEAAPLPTTPSSGPSNNGSDDDVLRNLMAFIRQGARTDQDTCGTAFRIFEKELMLMKPFLMYCGVFGGTMAMRNKYYMKMQSESLMQVSCIYANMTFWAFTHTRMC